jgi:adenylate cyclase
VPSERLERRLAALLSADAVGYSRMMADDDVTTIRTLEGHRAEMARLVHEHRGRVVDSPGDNLLAEFPSSSDAVACALDVQRALAERNGPLPEPRRLVYRIGVHVGEVIREGERIYGDGVNVAARLEALAEPGRVCISGAVREQVQRLGLAFDLLGKRELKNIPFPVEAFPIRYSAPPIAPRLDWRRRIG